jgi:DNA primase
MLSEDKITEIRDSVDLVALISEYVPLRRQGARFVGLCPFHTEKSPSFGVSRGKNFYYCFGCHASGDAIGFLRHVEGLSFPEALEKLAERSGIEIPRTEDPAQEAMARARHQRERLAEVMALAQEFYEEQLRTHPQGDHARDEIDKRGVSPEIAQKFHLGFAPPAWDALAQFFASRRVEPRDAIEVGLIAPRRQGNGHYDRFRNRLMFPVADQHGRIIAFSGRALPSLSPEPEDPPPAKYINSPEGPLYKKGQALFGIHAARVAMRKHNQALLCEGNFDLLSIHQVGFEHVIAPLGTAFTLDQAKLIRRFCEEVVVVFDGDNAGRKATRAAFDLLEQTGLRGRVVRLPAGHDPDSFVRAEGAESLRLRVQNAPLMLDFLIDDAADGAGDAAARGRAIQSLGPILARIESPVERGLYVERVARKFDIRDLELVRAELRRGVRLAKEAPAALSARGTGVVPPGGSAGDAQPSRFAGRGASSSSAPNAASAETVSRPAPTPVRKPAELPGRQCEVIGALLDCPALFASPEAQRLDGLLTDPDLQAIFRFTARLVEIGGVVDAPVLLEGMSSNPARAWLSKRLSESPLLSADQAKSVVENAMPLLDKDRRQTEAARMKKEIDDARRNGDNERADRLTRMRIEVLKS